MNMITAMDILPVYDMSVNVRVEWQAHGLSNTGTNGTNRLMARRQLLADGTETDACSGNIFKHHHAVWFAEHCAAAGIELCPACAEGDGRRAAALVSLPEYKNMTVERMLRECAVCDVHGFLVTAKNAASDGTTKARQRLSKQTAIEFSYALGLPGWQAETVQLTTRVGDSKDEGQMLMKRSARSGAYALCIRYRGVGVGVDTDTWNVAVTDDAERVKRHRAVLAVLRDQLLSPGGALTASQLPHVTGIAGAVVVRSTVGRAPLYSALQDDFIAQLTATQADTCQVFSFDSVATFYPLMEQLIHTSVPCAPAPRR